jgi:hypothetical protein
VRFERCIPRTQYGIFSECAASTRKKARVMSLSYEIKPGRYSSYAHCYCFTQLSCSIFLCTEDHARTFLDQLGERPHAFRASISRPFGPSKLDSLRSCSVGPSCRCTAIYGRTTARIPDGMETSKFLNAGCYQAQRNGRTQSSCKSNWRRGRNLPKAPWMRTQRPSKAPLNSSTPKPVVTG